MSTTCPQLLPSGGSTSNILQNAISDTFISASPKLLGLALYIVQFDVQDFILPCACE